jgi:hypothetical protein
MSTYTAVVGSPASSFDPPDECRLEAHSLRTFEVEQVRGDHHDFIPLQPQLL